MLFCSALLCVLLLYVLSYSMLFFALFCLAIFALIYCLFSPIVYLQLSFAPLSASFDLLYLTSKAPYVFLIPTYPPIQLYLNPSPSPVLSRLTSLFFFIAWCTCKCACTCIYLCSIYENQSQYLTPALRFHKTKITQRYIDTYKCIKAQMYRNGIHTNSHKLTLSQAWTMDHTDG